MRLFLALLSMAAAWPPDPGLLREPQEIIVPQDTATQSALRQAHPGLRVFLRGRPAWRASIDPLTGSVERAAGDGIPRDQLDLSGLLAPGLEQDGSSLVLNEASDRPLVDPAKKIIMYDLFMDGIPVLGAGLSLGVHDDRVVLITSRALMRVATSSKPKLSSDEALAAAAAYAGMPGLLASARQPALAFLPRVEGDPGAQALRHHLIWTLELKPPEAPPWQGYVVWVDAHDGEILAFFPEAQTASSCTADPQQLRGTVAGGVRPNRGDDAEVTLQLPFARVSQGGVQSDADLNGRYPFAGGAASSSLAGRFFRIHCDNCSLPSQPAASADPAGRINFGTGGASSFPPVFGNGTSTPADRTAYFQLNEARRLMDKWGNAFMDEIDVFVNIADVCNAFSSSYMLGFFAGGGGCRNSGEIRDVMQHELGHTWDRFDGTRITSGALSEWKGDVIAILMGGDACVGESLFLNGGPSSVCGGVRDLDEKAPGRTDHPLTPGQCPTCATVTRSSNTCGGSSHCLGEISGQATWHLYNNLVNGRDYITNAVLPGANPAFTPEQARWLMERLLLGGGAPMLTWDPAAAGTSSYDAIMFLDDNDGNLANGTPHAAYINAAWVHHDINEALVADSANCVDPADPVATATLERDAATGLPRAVIDWVPVGGATSFDVYRNTRAGDAFLPVAQNVASGPVVDSGIQPGRTYRYFVAAVQRTGCAGISPGNNVVTLTAGDPELAVASLTVAEAPAGSDGDGRVEPGETARVQVGLRESAGIAAAQAVTASLSASDPGVAVQAGGPALIGTIPAGSTSAAIASFDIFLGPSLACGSSARAVVGSSADEGCWQESVTIPLDATAGCAPTATAFVQVVPGSVTVISSAGDADGSADNCEVTTLRYTVRNTGTAPSGAVLVTAASSHPGVTFGGSPSCAPGSLAGGASAFCQLTFSLGSAGSAGIPFTLTATAANSPAPSVSTFTLGAETNPPVFATQTYGFEGSLQGWTGQQFSLSTARAFTGASSAHSGSVTQNNLCGKLLSPAFLVNSTGTSTLSFRLWGDIEPRTDQWYDRANVHVVDVDNGTETLINPTSGPAYNASGNPQGGICHIPGENGWGGNVGSFVNVTFSLSAFQGRRIRVLINYNTDEGDDREGIYVDDVAITNVAVLPLPADAQSDVCTVPEVSPQSAVVDLGIERLPGDLYRFDWQDLGAGFAYNLYAGTIGSFYDHGGAALTCAAGNAGVSCDGTQCVVDHAGASIPGSRYFLVTATGFGLEGTSGFASGGAERPTGQSSCQP